MAAPLPFQYPRPLPVYRAGTTVNSHTAASDVLYIPGVAGLLIVVLRASLVAGITTAVNLSCLWALRTAADTGGTASNLTAQPLDTAWPAAQSIPKIYTAAPTLGAGAALQVERILVGPSPTANQYSVLDARSAPVILRGTAQALAFQWLTAPATAPSVQCWVEWAEVEA